nr:CoF synthetase [Pseudotabrizicola algicola]
MRALALLAFVRTLWVSRRRARADFLRWQDKVYARWRRRDVPRVAFYAGRQDLPVVDKAVLMADFAAFNRAGITAEQGWAAFAGSRRIGRFTVGASTGTSGNRGLFVISEAERFQWLGVMLAKALPDVWRRRHRVAVILPLHTALYDSAAQSRMLRLSFHDLNGDWAVWAEEVRRANPTVIVAPPKVLVWLAAQGGVRPERVFAAAETLDPPDRAAIEAGFGVTLGQIYMATEGLLGVSCAHGRLHLAEDVVRFEFEPVGDLVSPVISSFTRRTQILARYRMNDLLRLSDRPCACGSPLLAVDEVVGRADDVFRFGDVQITPDVLRNAVLDADRRITDFRLEQRGAGVVVLSLPDETGMEAAACALRGLFAARGVAVAVRAEVVPLRPDARKLRRVRVVRDGG